MTGRGGRLFVRFGGLLVGLVMALAIGVAGVRADEAPAIAPFSTAHLRLSGTISAQGQELPIQGEGEIDATRRASHFTVGVLGATFETIIIGGRTYSRNALSGRWEYTEGPQANGFNIAQLIPYDTEVIRAAGRNFSRVGAETLAGTPTTHWRADVDLARLLGVGSGGAAASFTTNNATMDLWIGAADSGLRQLALDAQGATVDAAGAASPFKQVITISFDGLGAPVAIAAPPGATLAATPVATPGARGTPPGAVAGGGLVGLPTAAAQAVPSVARPTALALPVVSSSPSPALSASTASSRLVLQGVAVVSLVVVMAAGVGAARRRQR